MRSVHFAGPEALRDFCANILNDLIGPGLWAFDDVVEGFRWYDSWQTRPDMHDEGLEWFVNMDIVSEPFELRRKDKAMWRDSNGQPIPGTEGWAKPPHDPNGAAAWPNFPPFTPRYGKSPAADFLEAVRKLNEVGPELADAIDIEACHQHIRDIEEATFGDEAPAGAAAPQRLVASAEARKHVPLVTGLLDYFPDALAAVAHLSDAASVQHGHDEMFWERGKSNDHADCLARHLLDRGTADTDGILHSVKVAWRALALLQLELEESRGLPISRGSR